MECSFFSLFFLFIINFLLVWHERRKLLRTRKSRKLIRLEETSEKFRRKVLPGLLKQLKADRPLLEPVMTRVSAPSKVSWGLHSTRYVQQQPTWSPGVAGRCPGPRASLRARQRHGLTPDLLLSSPGIQRTRASNTFEPENFPEFSTN